MGHYKSNVRDLEFNLFEVLGVDSVLEQGGYGELDAVGVRDMLREVKRLAEGPLGESYAATDRHPPTFDPQTHIVSLPEPFKKAFRALQAGDWALVGVAEELGGQPAPRAVSWALTEMIVSAQPAAHLYNAGPAFANIFYNNGTDEQKKWARKIADRNWGATMVLTEPDAGSDVGAGRTRAIRQEDGSWHIEGVKRFITSGDSDDLFENIMHLVLARPEGAGPGTKGLSLFYVPKFHFDFDTDTLGERNGVFVTNVEHKMGLKASATCELTFGGHGVPAKGWLVGEVHDGIAQMFDVIENARMMVGTKAIGTLSTGYLNALQYAKTRVQGADLTRMTDGDAPRVTITHHPDVRRSLMMQKAYAEGLRAIYLYTAAHQNDDVAQLVSGADSDIAFRVNDLLLPIVKGVGSERAYQYLTDSLQIFGGSGFLQDYPIEQYIRDAKIDSLYEGTTAIQAQDFFFRKIIRDKGVALRHLTGRITAFLDSENALDTLGTERALLKTALEDVHEMTMAMSGYMAGAQQDPRQLYKIGLASVRFLLAVGDLLIGWRLLHNAEVALEALRRGAGGADQPFYEGKVAAASFFAKNVLPSLTSTRSILCEVSIDVMQLDEAVF
ncbi:acyl-CoA dehydrogenase [Nocardia sp. NEAU-G5]|uniref:Acyl-CoA dehydrogenase n=1 Tax=Nocardia albiluteola TaxID=2842303 RepID=A0ABS6AZ05_9NOCA|nr:acyl-CoA dehydrogenase [Nocardia albiluteola]MBU3063291.1 acyl-CoA dehydrogenase [Nocardia albiluteola]